MAENHHTDLKPPRASWRRLAPIGFLLLLTVAFYWKLTLTRQYTWFDHPDMAYLEIPRLQFQMKEIQAGRFPLWDPHIWSGQPLIGQTQPGPLFPLNLIFFETPMRDGYLKFSQLNFYWAGIHFLAALFAYLLLRDLGLSQASGVMGGVVFAFGGFVGSVAWLDVVNGGIWAPLVMLFVWRALRGLRPWANGAMGGLVLGVAWLSGHHEIPILLSLMTAGCWAWRLRHDRTLIGPGTLFFVVTFLIGAVQTLPTFEFGRLSLRWVGIEHVVGWGDKIPYRVHTIYSLPVKGLLATFLPSFGTFADASPFIGCVATALALFAIAARWSDPMVKMSTAIAAVTVVYALGAFGPLQGAMYAVLPIVDKARIPSRATLVLNFALAVLAAYGLETILRESGSAALRTMRRILISFGLAVVGVAVTATIFKPDIDDRTFLAGAVCVAGFALLTGWQRGALSRITVFAGLLVLVLTELTNGAPALYSDSTKPDGNRFLKTLTQHADVVAYLRSLKEGPLRVNVDDQAIGANFGDWHDIDMMYGYVAGVSANVFAHEMHTPRTQELFSITHFLSTKAERAGQQEVFRGKDGVNVYRNPNVLPRVRIVHEARSVLDASWLRVGVQNPEVDLSKTALLIGKPPVLQSCAGEEQARIAARTTDWLRIEVTAACRGLVVLAETMYPGWEATVDGRPVEMWEAYGAMRSVVVDAGNHVVEMKFRPHSVYWGAALSVLGVVLACGAYFFL